MKISKLNNLKNTSKYNPEIGGITCSFYPLNILTLPFALPLLFTKSTSLSEFLLKMQYWLMIIC